MYSFPFKTFELIVLALSIWFVQVETDQFIEEKSHTDLSESSGPSVSSRCVRIIESPFVLEQPFSRSEGSRRGIFLVNGKDQIRNEDNIYGRKITEVRRLLTKNDTEPFSLAFAET